MTLVIAMLVLSSVFMYVMAHSLIQGHNSVAFEFSIKLKLSDFYAQSEDDQVEKYGKAHAIVMDLAEAISEQDQILQYEQTQVAFQRAESYSHQVKSNRIDLPIVRQHKALLKVVK
ncbi:hypothetical protein ABMY35_09875 [Pseudoalteromonas sp. BZB3]|uniref:hypothetical protein n=1 Tax=Pseudoalteromonas sp. BZB3 TaxID=3136670 RepID=UPI0032C432A6